MGRRIRTYSGSTSAEATPVELEHRQLVRRAAAEGMVLLKNDGILPLSAGDRVCVYGKGISHVIKGGTGSGDVNERSVVPIAQGLADDGLVIVNEKEAFAAPAAYDAERNTWRDRIMEKLAAAGADSGMAFFKMLDETPFHYPELPIRKEDVQSAKAAIYIISRVSGEGSDRYAREGDYFLDEEEKSGLLTLSRYTDNIVLLINTGGQIDLTEATSNPCVKAILNISQPGMEAGHSVADVLTGKVNPSGHLTDTWARHYEDFPSAFSFSHNNGNLDTEKYEESIYVGYRYFESFGIPALYPFGYGLSYTTFDVRPGAVSQEGAFVKVSAAVTNTGTVPGKEVVQIYAALPQDVEKREPKKLIGFAKTKELGPGESVTVSVKITEEALAAFHAKDSAWVIDKGEYAVFVGTSSFDIALAGVLSVQDSFVTEKTKTILPLKESLHEIVRPDRTVAAFTAAWKKEQQEKGIEAVPFVPAAVPAKTVDISSDPLQKKAEGIAAKLTDDEITALLMGDITKGQDNLVDDALVETGIYVPGAAGETTSRLEDAYDVPAISMADGPAGLRLMRHYDVDRASGKIYSESLLAALNGGLFSKKHVHENADTYYMYATAIPIGTLLAQTWDTALVQEVGKMIGSEMNLFGIAWWLAPGMNIHRNPLCGRNFEYYSEDPVVAGNMAAAMTLGVQSNPGVGTTIKHFCCNNQEDNRMGVDAVVSERALREIYLRGFEIAVRTAQPMCIMTSYNLINGVHACNNYDTITECARNEWGFNGIVMTDWTTTTSGGASAHGCALAGNDLIMPGNDLDVKDIMQALEDGSLPRDIARKCCARLIRVILETNGMEDAIPYRDRFDLEQYQTVEN